MSKPLAAFAQPVCVCRAYTDIEFLAIYNLTKQMFVLAGRFWGRFVCEAWCAETHWAATACLKRLEFRVCTHTKKLYGFCDFNMHIMLAQKGNSFSSKDSVKRLHWGSHRIIWRELSCSMFILKNYGNILILFYYITRRLYFYI